jgi:HTH-type transcriptional repressor of NAD biosynthesis genes
MRCVAEPDTTDRVMRIALLGGESSGKTTLAQALAQALHTRWVPEYGRQRWEELRETLGVEELVRVARRQIEWEDTAAQALRDAHAKAAVTGAPKAEPARPSGRAPGGLWLVCDTTPLTTLQYCLHDHGQAPAALHQMARRRYALTVLCLPDFDFVQDGARRDDAYRAAQHAWTVAQLAAAGIAPLCVSGPLHQRLAQVLAALPAVATAWPASCVPGAQTSIAVRSPAVLESSPHTPSSGALP